MDSGCTVRKSGGSSFSSSPSPASSPRSSSGTDSYNSYATLPNECAVSLSEDDRHGAKKVLVVQESVPPSSLKNNAASTATLTYDLVRRDMLRCSSLRSHSSSTSSVFVKGNDDEEGDSSMAEDGGDNNSDSDYSMDDCDITIVDDSSFNKKSSPPKNEAELMFLQVVEILRYEKKVK